MKTLLALSFITYSRVVSGGACCEPSGGHVRGSGSVKEGGGDKTVTSAQLPLTVESAPIPMFESVLRDLECATTYEKYVGDVKDWQIYYNDLNPNQQRFFEAQIITGEVIVGDSTDFVRNCDLGRWYFNAGAQSDDAILAPFIESERFFTEAYKDPATFGTAYSDRPIHAGGLLSSLYYCYRERTENNDPDAAGNPDVLLFSTFIAGDPAGEGSELTQCGGKTEIENISRVSCPPNRLEALRALHKILYNADINRLGGAFQIESDRINKERPRYLHIGQHASITESREDATTSWRSRRMICLFTQIFGAVDILPECQCSEPEINVFERVGLGGFNMQKHQCKVPLVNHLLSLEHGRSCLLDQTYRTPLDFSVDVGDKTFGKLREQQS